LVKQVLDKQLPEYMGPPFDDVIGIQAIASDELEFRLRRRSAFLIEGLDLPIQIPDTNAGTGPFSVGESGTDFASLESNPRYYGGKPLIDKIAIRPYESVRAAWADLLRGEVDMLYEVGVDALDSLSPSSAVKVFTHQRNYAYMVLLNTRRPDLKDPKLRRALSNAVDREAVVQQGLGGHARPASSPVWPSHWVNDESAAKFVYEPEPINTPKPLHLTFLFTDPSHERLALFVERYLETVGVDITLEQVPLDQALARVRSGDFDGWLVDAVQGPTMLRPYWFWHSEGPFNWGKYKNPRVDAALDHIRHAANDHEYKAGVTAFQRAMVDDPPAIFLAWSERARAVSTRFEVPVEAGRDILSTLRLWRPAGIPRIADRN
jgi:peptide/nickel transport system substrate-binding protein